MATTIKTIAEHFGVSLSTASRALNDSGYVKQELREAIKVYARENNWHPSSAAVSMATGKTKTIAFLVNIMTFYHNQMILDEVLKAARKTNYHVFLSQCSNSEEQTAELESYINRNPEIVIVVSLLPSPKTANAIKQLKAQGSMVIAVGKSFPEYCVALEYDYEQQGYLAMKYLSEKKHKKIMLIGQFTELENLKQKLREADKFIGGKILAGIEKAAKETGTDFDRFRDVTSDNFRNYDHVVKLIRKKSHTAFICENDALLKDFYWLCRENKINIPDDISVIGLGHSPSLRGFNPAPTCINEHGDKMAETIASLVLSQKADFNTRTLIHPDLINGNSVKKLEI